MDALAEVLAQMGNIALPQLVGLLVHTILFFLLYTGLMGATLLSLARRGRLTSKTRVLVGITLFLYIVSSVSWVVATGEVFTLLWTLSYGRYPGDSSIDDRVGAALLSTQNTGRVREALFLSNMIVGNIPVLLSVWAVFWQNRNRIAFTAVPGVLLCASFGFAIADFLCLSLHGSETDPSTPPACSPTGLLAWAFAVAVDISSAGLILLRSWQFRREMRQSNSTSTVVSTILRRLGIAALTYGLLWLTQVVCFLSVKYGTGRVYAFFILGSFGQQLPGLYPALMSLALTDGLTRDQTIDQELLLSSWTQDSRTVWASADGDEPKNENWEELGLKEAGTSLVFRPASAPPMLGAQTTFI